MFSYGSGLTAKIFSLKLQDGQHPFNLLDIATVMNVSEKLKVRYKVFLPSSFLPLTLLCLPDSVCLSWFQGQELSMIRWNKITRINAVPCVTICKLFQPLVEFLLY